VALAGTAAFAAFIWWPNGDYRPIQPGEKGTIQGAVEQLAAVPTGRPALTKARVQQLGGAPLASANGGDSAPSGKTQLSGQPVSTEPAATTESTTTVVETTPSGETTTVATTAAAPSASSTASPSSTTAATATTTDSGGGGTVGATISTPVATETVQATTP
jgi:hypothetical protein